MNPQERAQLRKFIHSPFFVHPTQQARLIQLYACIDASAPRFHPARLKKEIVHQRLFPNEAYSKVRLEKLMSKLFQKVQTFIHLQYSPTLKEELHQQRALAKFYQIKKLDSLLQSTMKRLQQILQTETQEDREHYHHSFLVENDILEQEGLFNTRRGDLNIPATLFHLDRYYLLSRLEYTCMLLAQFRFQSPATVQQEEALIQQMLPLTQLLSDYNSPSIKIYQMAFRLLQDIDNPKYYEALKTEMTLYQSALSAEQEKALHAICRNYCIFHFNKGQKSFLPETFQRYRMDLEKGLLFYQNGLLPSTIKNLVDLGLRMEKHQWVEELLHDYRHRITGTKHPDDIYRFNKADILFRTQQKTKALQFLSYQFEDIYYKIAAKRMELKILYDTQADQLDDKMDAFKIYIFRHSKKKLDKNHQTANNNFINTLRQIRNPLSFRNPQRIARLTQKIDQQKTISEKGWLLDKIKEMK